MGRLYFTMIVACGIVIVASMILTLVTDERDRDTEKAMTKVDLMIAAKRYEAAEKAIGELFPEPDARPGDVWLRLGICRSMLEDLDGADGLFTKGLEADPKNTKLLYNQALLYGRMNQNEKSEAALWRVKKAAPYFPEVFYHLGRLAEERGDLETAEEFYVKELNLNPASHSAWRRHMMFKRGLTATTPSVSQEALQP